MENNINVYANFKGEKKIIFHGGSVRRHKIIFLLRRGEGGRIFVFLLRLFEMNGAISLGEYMRKAYYYQRATSNNFIQ